MITHCYLYRLREGISLKEAQEWLLSMQQHIPSIAQMEVGVNFSDAENAYDLVQLSRFSSREDYEAFQAHPYHQEVRLYFSRAAAQTVKADYEG